MRKLWQGYSWSVEVKLRSLITRADIALIVVFLVISGVLFAHFHKQSGSKVEIRYGDRLIGTFLLSEDQIIEIDDGIAAEIKDGKVHMLRSTCPHQVCVQQGWSSTPARPIICVPNKVYIRILGDDDEMMITE